MKQESFDKWIDLTDAEEERTYVFSDFSYKIVKPKSLYVKKSGSHKIVDCDDICHYLDKDFRAIRIKPKDKKGFSFNVELV